MREIKFRMYDKKAKVMSPIHLMEWGKIQHNLSYYRGYYDCDKSDWSVISCNNPDKQTGINFEGETVLVNRYEVMQYTGFKDINGIEIYEGDIVSHLYRYYIGHGNVDEQSETIVIEDIRNIPFDDSTIGCEVLGNVYENPELLKEVGV